MAKPKRLVLWITLGIIALLLVVLIGSVVGTYNSLVKLETTVQEMHSSVDTQLQRRNDLIPNLVSTVKGYAKHEKDLFLGVTEARSKVINADSLEEQAQASANLSSELTTLLNFTYENYPHIQANENFLALQNDLAGTENRITMARKDYNAAAKNYNAAVRSFPANLIAGAFGFEPVSYFEAEAGAEKVPEVNFE